VRGDLDEVGKAFLAAHGTFRNLDEPEPTRFVQGVLDRRSSDSCTIRDFINRYVTNAVALHLEGDNAKHGTLALGEVMSQRLRQSARAAEPALTHSALYSFAIRKTSAAFSWRKPAYHPAVDPADLSGMAGGHTAPTGTPALDRLDQVRRLSIADLALAPVLPEQPAGLIEMFHVRAGVDDVQKGEAVGTERSIFNLLYQFCGNALAHVRALRAALRIAASTLARTRKFPNGRSFTSNALYFLGPACTYRPSRSRPM
jgi:hypothetical protein